MGSIKEAVKFAKKIDEEVFIIGGGNIYEQTMDMVDKLEVTLVKADLEADTFFPKIDGKIWKKRMKPAMKKMRKICMISVFRRLKETKKKSKGPKSNLALQVNCDFRMIPATDKHGELTIHH